MADETTTTETTTATPPVVETPAPAPAPVITAPPADPGKADRMKEAVKKPAVISTEKAMKNAVAELIRATKAFADEFGKRDLDVYQASGYTVRFDDEGLRWLAVLR